MIAGTIEFDDINIDFKYNAQDGTVTYTVTDCLNGSQLQFTMMVCQTGNETTLQQSGPTVMIVD